MTVRGAAPLVAVFPDAPTLAATAATRLLAVAREAVAQRGVAHLVLTGGGIGTATLTAVAQSPDRDSVDWSRVHLWWGDERFLPEGHPERNARQARDALLDAVPAARVHAMPASDGPFGDDVDAAAAAYAGELATAAGPEGHPGPVPVFDVLLLGVGPDGHVASLFPGHPGVAVEDRTVIPVRESPKPPPVRISLTRPAIGVATEVWLLAAGAEKAPAVAEALRQAAADDGIAVPEPPDGAPGDGARLPSSLVRGREQTSWLVDASAAPAGG